MVGSGGCDIGSLRCCLLLAALGPQRCSLGSDLEFFAGGRADVFGCPFIPAASLPQSPPSR
jgi:hypothetical protein